ncbi:hypothetical protein [Leptospira kmetyi]|uniref:hypothetical protein n=1 Tax=Leptospira kmetyi TaxID=408139 RepID=UPI00143848BC|nr:hypothetical protein [Leptospira kmetyi]
MKIRWINEEVKPIPRSAKWIQFIAKYPFVLFLPATVLFTYAYYWNRWILEWESGETESLHLGSLKLAYNLFGRNGVVGFYILLGACCLWLFGSLRSANPKNRNVKSKLLFVYQIFSTEFGHLNRFLV